MTAEIKTVIGQLNIAGGNWRNETPNQVAVREPKTADTPGAGKGDLFVLTEVRGPIANDETLEKQLAQTIRDAYYLSRGSMTASLRRALQATNEQLYRYNSKVTADKKIVAGAVVLVICQEEAFAAQIGPTAFFAVLDDLIRRYPAQSSWLDSTAEPKEPALGFEAIIEPNLHHLHLTAGDMLVLADSRLAGYLSLNTVVRAVKSKNVKATIKNLGKALQRHDGSALALAVLEADQSAFATLKRKTPTQLHRFLGRGHDETHRQPAAPYNPKPPADITFPSSPPPEAAKTNRVMPPPMETEPRKSPRWFGRAAKNQEPESEQTELNQPRVAVAPPSPRPIYQDAPRVKTKAREMDSVAHNPSFQPGPDQTYQATVSSFSLGRMLRWVSAGMLLLVALLGNGLKNILSMVLPEGQERKPRQAGLQAGKYQTSPVSWVLLRNIVIFIPVVIAIIVGVIYLQKGRIREAEYQQFFVNAQEKFQQAQAVPTNPEAALGLIAEAENALVEAEKIKGVQPEITDLREQMHQAADQIGQVQRLYYLPQLRQYSDSGTKLAGLVVEGVEVYVLDAGTNRLFHHRLDDLGETLLPDDGEVLLVGQGQQVGNLTVSALLGMTWMPAGGNRQTSDLVVLSGNGLLEYNSSWGMTTSALANQATAATPVAVSSYFGNFYVLDPQANQLLRYLPTADGYNAPPESYFPPDQPVNLTGAVDFTIDGAVYILFSDGRINKFQGGLPVEFSVTGLDMPLRNPVAIFTAPDEDVQYLYVADAGNQRIVQLEKDGRFLRQFKPSVGEGVTFANLQDTFVDEIGGRLYILDSNNLYVGNMPTVE